MKVKLPKMSEEEIRKIAENPDTQVKITDPWWIIVLKVVAYVIGLILAGAGTAAAANVII